MDQHRIERSTTDRRTCHRSKKREPCFAAVLGHPYGPNTERGIYRTLDGGKTWEQVLYKDENTGAIQVTIDPNNSNIIYADMWAGRQGPWENGAWNGSESGLFGVMEEPPGKN